jgi:hypothetical protein
MKVLIACCACLGLVLAAPVIAAPAQVLSAKAAAEWREDLHALASELPRRHRDLYHAMTREEFDSAVRVLDARIPSLTRNQVIVEMARIVAMTGDGHTQMGLTWDPKIGFHQYPIRFYVYSDGLFVRMADAQYAQAVGARVLRIGNRSAEEAMQLLEKIVQRDNAMTVKDVLPSRLVMPEVLEALGIVDDPERAPFVLRDRAGHEFTVTLSPAAAGAAVKWVRANQDAAAPLPIYLKDPGNPFWFEYLKDRRTLYVQYNAVQDKEDETVAHFFERVLAFVKDNDVDKFILDIRLNNGGDNTLNLPIIHGLLKCGKINRKGHLFTIIGRLTFSAAQNLTNELQKHTNTLFVGEPTGGSPNHYGEAENFTLPHSGIIIRASTLWWQDMDPRDKRPWTAPQVPAALSSEDYRLNIDPALDAIFSYPAEPDAEPAGTACGC